MSKPMIAVDIDEVLAPFVSGIVPWHNLRYGTDLKFQDFHTYEFNKVWGGDRELAIRKCADHFENRGTVQPLADALRVLTRLKQDYSLMIITSRNLTHKSITETWVNTHFPDIFQEILLCNHWDKDSSGPIIKKSAACLLHGAQYLIDDLPYYMTEAASAGIHGLLFGDYPWNRQTLTHPQIHRVSHWPDVENFFYPKPVS